jgi:uncharacterized membrane protein YgcG
MLARALTTTPVMMAVGMGTTGTTTWTTAAAATTTDRSKPGTTTIVQLFPSSPPSTLTHMDSSWLERGHGSNPAHLDTIFTGAQRNRPLGPDHSRGVPDPVATPTRTPHRSSRLVVVTALWFGIIVGTSGAAWAVRDALFPSIGPAEVSVWQNPGRDTQPAPSDDSTTTTSASPTVAVTPTAVDTPTSVDDHGSDDGPDNSTTPATDDDGNKHGESTVVTVADDTPSSVDDHGGGHDGSGPGDDSGSGGGSGSGSGHGSDSGGGSGSGGGSDG